MATLHLITTQPVSRMSGLGATPAAEVSRGQIPQHTGNGGTVEAHPPQHIISHLPAVLRLPGCSHLVTKEIHHHTAKKIPRATNRPAA